MLPQFLWECVSRDVFIWCDHNTLGYYFLKTSYAVADTEGPDLRSWGTFVFGTAPIWGAVQRDNSVWELQAEKVRF